MARRNNERKPNPPLDPRALHRAVNEAKTIADSENVEVALAGGVAMQLYGSPRLTGDVDIISDKEPFGVPEGGRLTIGGISTEVSGVPVDFIVRDDIYRGLYEEALHNARRPPTSDVKMLVVAPEYLVAMKIAARRGKDADDVDWLLESGMLDMPKTRKIVLRHLGAYGLEELNERIVEGQLFDERNKRTAALRQN
jgi:hypothetical protein